MRLSVRERLDARTLNSVQAYDDHARDYQEGLRRHRPLPEIRRFASFVPPKTMVLDAGCGPASDLRLLRDAGLRPVGIDLSHGALVVARLLLPRQPLVRAPYDAIPFREGVFGGLWLSGAFNHLPKRQWAPTLANLLRYVSSGPVYFSCVRGDTDLQQIDDELLGPTYRSDATAGDVEQLLVSAGCKVLNVELRPDAIVDRRRPWVVALAQLPE